jgi:hypothetical protein
MANPTVTRFRGAPSELRATLPLDVARRVTYTATPRGLGTLYRYRLHVDRTLAHEHLNRADNSARLLVAVEPAPRGLAHA